MEEVKVGDLTIKPSLNKGLQEIHPAIGAVDDTAYIGEWVPCQIVEKDGKVALRDLLYLVTDNREMILANDNVLREKGWVLGYKPIKFKNRWPLDSVQDYLNGATVDPCKVLDHLIDAWTEYMEFPDNREYVYHALWDIGSYFHHLFTAFPYLYVGGIKRCGKTKDLTLHSCLAFNAFFSNNMSTASIYRLIQNARGTLLIDETEKLGQKYGMSERTLEFRSILLAGYKKGALVYRVEKTRKEMLQPESFGVYSPKALANIEGLEDVLEDRCKNVVLRKSRDKQILNREVQIDDPKWSELHSELYIFYLTFWKEINDIYNKIGELSERNELVNLIRTHLPDVKDEDLELFTGREMELWKAIIALATFFDMKNYVLQNKFTNALGSLRSLMFAVAIDTAKQRHIEDITETGETILVQILSQTIQENGYYKVKDLKDEMAKAFDEEQKWLTTRWLGAALRRLGFKEKRRVGTGYEYFFFVEEVQDLAKRMEIGVVPTEKTELEKVAEVRTWVFESRKDGMVSASQLADFITSLGLEPQKIVSKLKEEGLLFPISEPNKWGVSIGGGESHDS